MRPGRVTRLLAALAACLVLALAGCGMEAGGLDGIGSPSGEPSPVSTGRTQSPTSPNTPSTAGTLTASPSAITGLKSCRPQQLTVSSGPGGAAAGSSFLRIELHNVSDHACQLRGYLMLDFVDRSGQLIARARRDRTNVYTLTTVEIPAGRWGHARLQIVSPGNFDPGSPDCRPKEVAFALVSLPRYRSDATRLPLGYEVCTAAKHVPSLSPIVKGRRFPQSGSG